MVQYIIIEAFAFFTVKSSARRKLEPLSGLHLVGFLVRVRFSVLKSAVVTLSGEAGTWRQRRALGRVVKLIVVLIADSSSRKSHVEVADAHFQDMRRIDFEII